MTRPSLPAWRPQAADILKHAIDDRPEQALPALQAFAFEHGPLAVCEAMLFWADQALAALRRRYPGAERVKLDLHVLDETGEPDHADEDARMTWAAALVDARATGDRARQRTLMAETTADPHWALRVIACLRICAALLTSTEETAS